MVSPAKSEPATKPAAARGHVAKVALETAVNIGLPFLIYSFSNERLGAVPALMVASVPPLLWSVIELIRVRRLDAISLLVLCGIALSLAGFAGGGGIKFLQLRENLVTGLVGLIFLGSVAIGRPLIYQLARAGTRRFSPGRVTAFEALRKERGFRRAMLIATLAWAFGLLAACAVNCTLVFVLSIQLFMLVSGPISYATMGLLTVWTSWYVPRAMKLAEARRAGAAESPLVR